MASVVGVNGLHAVIGYICDLCGDKCDPITQELNALTCTFPKCPEECSVYHQDCLEKYLKSTRLEKNRKTGFKCPRGCGKGTTSSGACPGKIDKSHPIHIRNEESKKRRKAKAPEVPVGPTKQPAAKHKGREDEVKEDKKGKERRQDPVRQQATAIPIKLTPATKPVKAVPAKQASQKEQLAAAAAAVRKELGLVTSQLQRSVSGSLTGRDVRTLEEYEAARAGPCKDPPPPAPQNAWAGRALTSNSPPPDVHSEEAFPAPGAAPRHLKEPAGQQHEQNLRGAWGYKDASHSRLGIDLLKVGPPPPPPPRPTQSQQQAPSGGGLPPTPTSTVSQYSTDTQLMTEQHDSAPLPVGMQYEAGDKMNKAQRKNLKRLERKAAQRKAQAGQQPSAPSSVAESLTSSETALSAQHSLTLVEAEPDLEAFAACIQAMVTHKAQHLTHQFRQLGFEEWKCIAAVQMFGGDVEQAAAWLLEGHAQSHAEAQKMACKAAPPDVDVSEDLQRLLQVQRWLGFPAPVVEHAVIEARGNIDAAIAYLQEHYEFAGEAEQQSPHREDISRQDSIASSQDPIVPGPLKAITTSNLRLEKSAALEFGGAFGGDMNGREFGPLAATDASPNRPQSHNSGLSIGSPGVDLLGGLFINRVHLGERTNGDSEYASMGSMHSTTSFLNGDAASSWQSSHDSLAGYGTSHSALSLTRDGSSAFHWNENRLGTAGSNASSSFSMFANNGNGRALHHLRLQYASESPQHGVNSAKSVFSPVRHDHPDSGGRFASSHANNRLESHLLSQHLGLASQNSWDSSSASFWSNAQKLPQEAASQVREVPEAALFAAAAVASEADAPANAGIEEHELDALMATLMCC